MAATTSRAFLAKLPPLSVEERARVEAWVAKHCARSAVFVHGGLLYLCAQRETPRTCKMQCRLLRAGLARCGVTLPTQRSRWLILLDEKEEFEGLLRRHNTEVKAKEASAELRCVTVSAPQHGATVAATGNPAPDGDERCVDLPSAKVGRGSVAQHASGSAAGSRCVVVKADETAGAAR